MLSIIFKKNYLKIFSIITTKPGVSIKPALPGSPLSLLFKNPVKIFC